MSFFFCKIKYHISRVTIATGKQPEGFVVLFLFSYYI